MREKETGPRFGTELQAFLHGFTPSHREMPRPHGPQWAHTLNLPPYTCPGLYSLSPIFARCNLLTQEILLRGFGVMNTTMKLMGRPDLRRAR